MVHLLAATALAAAAPNTVSSAAPPSPAIYVVHDADTTVYLFGSFHILDPGTEWLDGKVRTAFDQSNELVLETLVPKDPAAPMPQVHGMNASVAPSASFLATTRMAVKAGQAQGMRVANGADMVLRDLADAEGKPVAGLETLESQFAMFAKMPAPQVRAPKPGEPVDARETISTAMAEMQAAWKRGDQAPLVQMIDKLRRNAPQTYKLLFADRNSRWADWIAARMQTPGVVFVAVGAGHFSGKDSVLVRLAEQGIESTRLN